MKLLLKPECTSNSPIVAVNAVIQNLLVALYVLGDQVFDSKRHSKMDYPFKNGLPQISYSPFIILMWTSYMS